MVLVKFSFPHILQQRSRIPLKQNGERNSRLSHSLCFICQRYEKIDLNKSQRLESIKSIAPRVLHSISSLIVVSEFCLSW